MGADDARADPVLGHRAQRLAVRLLGRGHEGRLERGRAGLQQRLPDARVAVGVGGHQVDAGEAVDLQVDEPRRRDAGAAVGQPDRADAAVLDRHVAGEQLAVDQRGFDAQPHQPFTAPPVRAVIRCLRARRNTIATGSV
jgi:hypothetical protein